MAYITTLRRSGDSLVITNPKAVAYALAVDAGSVVALTIVGNVLSVTPARRGLAERLRASPTSPADWPRDPDFLSMVP